MQQGINEARSAEEAVAALQIKLAAASSDDERAYIHNQIALLPLFKRIIKDEKINNTEKVSEFAFQIGMCLSAVIGHSFLTIPEEDFQAVVQDTAHALASGFCGGISQIVIMNGSKLENIAREGRA